MGWCHPDISIDELLPLVKSFVDILVLAGGHLSSGAAASWDAAAVKSALRWAAFFVQVFERLRGFGGYEDSMEELDAALLDLTSSPLFPRGIANISSEDLSRASELVVKRFLDAQPVTAEHLKVLLSATVEMDTWGAPSPKAETCKEYMEYLMLELNSLSMPSVDKGKPKEFGAALMECDIADHARDAPCSRPSTSRNVGSTVSPPSLSAFLIKEILKRQNSSSCISLAESGLSTLLSSLTKSGSGMPGCALYQGESEMVEVYIQWKNWKSRCLSYLLDHRTVGIVSAANLIFSSPKDQWIRVFEQLESSARSSSANHLEILEILFLGLVSRNWNHLIENLVSHLFDSATLHEQYDNLQNLSQGIYYEGNQDKLGVDPKEMDILERATHILLSRLPLLWSLPAVIIAAALPLWSHLFRVYVDEIGKQYNNPSKERPCGCYENATDHQNCALGDGIRCLYAFHVQRRFSNSPRLLGNQENTVPVL